MRRTCRCISAPWTARSRPSSARTRARSRRATSTPSTRPITAAPTCPTSRCARRCSTTPAAASCSGWRAAATTPTSAASRPARCRPTRPRSSRRASISTSSSWSIAAAFAKPRCYALLTGAKYPARNPLQNVNDLKAQIAANQKGAHELRKMVAQFGLAVVEAYMRHVQDNAAESVRRVIDRLHDCAFAYEMDQGTWIKVKISVDKAKREATVDFTGTSPQQPSNFNAPEPVTRAAVLYVFRVMVDDDIPMNAGCLEPIRIVIPPGSMLSPQFPAAVVAGNVETSQAVTELPVRRARRHGGRAGHHEQSQFRQRELSVLRDHLLGLAGRPRLSGHRRGADPHDQHAAHRSRGARVPLSGGAGGFPHPRRLRRPRPLERGRRHLRAPSGFSSRWNARSCRATGGCARSGSPAARPAKSARIGCAARDGSREQLQACDATTIGAGEAIIIQTPTAGGYGRP